MTDAKITRADGPITVAVPVLWEITTEDQHGHRTVTRVHAATEDEARRLLDDQAPDVVEVRRP